MLGAVLVLLLLGTGPACGMYTPVPPEQGSPARRKQALTIVLVDKSITDFISRDLPIGFCRFSPAQLRHGGRHNIESQAARLAGD